MEWSWVPELETAIVGPGKRPGESFEIMAGAALLDRPSDSELREHVASRLIDRLARFSDDRVSDRRGSFYLLSVTERVILVLLHRARWSYAAVGKLLGLSGEQLEELAWMTRLELARRAGAVSHHPAGTPRSRTDCPEYIPARPWTQRWADGVYSGTEKLFLQQHLERCATCRDIALRSRRIFYAVEAALPASEGGHERAIHLETAFRKTRYLEHPQEQKLSEAFLEALFEVVRKPLFWGVVGTAVLLAFLN